MKRTGKQLTNQLIELRNAIKRKYKTFKQGAEESDLFLEKQYKPIIQELRKTTTVSSDIKHEPETFKEEPMDYSTTPEESDEEFIPTDVSTPKAKDLSELLSTPSKLASTTQFIEEYFQNPLTREYIAQFLKDSSNKRTIDYVYGPRYMDDGVLMVGSKKLDFDENGNIIVGSTNYGASEGLYELIFKKVPDSSTYTADDLKTYKSILFATNAHREGFKPTGKLKGNKSTKYTRIIKNLFQTPRGSGLAWKNAKSHDIIHWDDPNELVGRLRHITMSTETGNRVHSNEILSIVEELREAGFIKGPGNSRFKSLLQ